MTKNVKKLLIILGVLIAIAVAVVLLPKIKKEPESALISTSATTNIPANMNANIPINSPDPSREFVSLLQSIKSITLDTTLIQSKAFQSLVNHGTVLPENAPSGRPNPFAVIGDDVSVIKQPEIQINSSEKENKKTQPQVDTGIDSSIYEIDSLLNGL